MGKHTIGLQRQHFLPEHEQKMFVTGERLKTVFRNISEELVAYITDRARCTFLITLLIMQNEVDGLAAMEAFCAHGFTDASCLPVQRTTGLDKPLRLALCGRDWDDEPLGCAVCDVHSNDRCDKICQHDDELDAFHHTCWDLTSFGQFYDKQWQFCVQEFNDLQFQYDNIPDEKLLPLLVQDEARQNSSADIQQTGNFGDVRQAWILASHFQQTLPASSSAYPSAPLCPMKVVDSAGIQQDAIKIAIKTLKPIQQNQYNLQSEYEREAAAHKTLNALQHPHLVRGLAAFRHQGDYHLLLEWADGGSLRTFWNDNPQPKLTATSVQELLDQLCGLADALYHMHNTRKPRSQANSAHSRGSSSSSQIVARDFASDAGKKRVRLLVDDGFGAGTDVPASPQSGAEGDPGSPLQLVPTIEISPAGRSEETHGENWRHGDIKPENILRFVSPAQHDANETVIGTLKLADLGRAKQHMNPTHVRSDLEIDNWHTRNYEPPDIHVDKRRTTSRLYDIWSLGCVFFEAIVWILYGPDELVNYKTTSFERDRKGSFYWTKGGLAGAQVSQMAALWMNTILKDDPECNDSSALRDLVLLIRDKMLVIELPKESDKYEAKCRASASVVVQDLERILERARSDRSYLFTGRDRKDVKAPPSGNAVDNLLRVNVPTLNITPPRQRTRRQDPKSMLGPPAMGLDVPGGNTASATSLRRQNSYTHALSETWSYQNDDDFAASTIAALSRKDRTTFDIFFKPTLRMCQKCSQFDPRVPNSFQDRSLKALRNLSKRCRLCQLVLEKAEAAGIKSGTSVNLVRHGGLLKVNGRNDAVLRICRTPGMSPLQSVELHPS